MQIARTQEHFDESAPGSDHVGIRKNSLKASSLALVLYTWSKQEFLEYSIESVWTHTEQRINDLPLFKLKELDILGIE